MKLSLAHIRDHLHGDFTLSGSKSESNRALIVSALSGQNSTVQGLAEAEDTRVLKMLLQTIQQNESATLDVGIAGTVMRFLTAYLAITKGEWVLTGDDRMKQRPIGILVEALRSLGASIEYLEQEGFPPIKISGKSLKGGEISIAGDVSSQYISALLMIGPYLEKGMVLSFVGEILSKPYIDMTLGIIKHFGASAVWANNKIHVKPGSYQGKTVAIEGDWSAASYFYGFAALAEEVDITLKGLKKDSLQGDAIVSKYYEQLGVETSFDQDGIHLSTTKGFVFPDELEFDFTTCPDIAQTLAVTCAALNIKARLVGLKTLRIKETDRIEALRTELSNLGFNVAVEKDDLLIQPVKEVYWDNPTIKTYNDHRMAMAFAPLALVDEINIEDPEVVKKSYPGFWEDIKQLN